MGVLQIIAIGRLRAGEPEAVLVARYAARVRPTLQLIELAEARGSPAEVKRREGEALIAALPPRAFAVALDQGGIAPDSVTFAKRFETWLGLGRPLCFLIGGAEGLHRAVLDRAAAVLSFGPMTWPHHLARVMLAEQLYRARAIAFGAPYHRHGRP